MLRGRKYLCSPVAKLPAAQWLIYDELPPSFEARKGVEIAARYWDDGGVLQEVVSYELFQEGQ